jgi:Fic family protein
MTWNWQQKSWPHFTSNEARLAAAEREFLLRGGVLLGSIKHLSEDDRNQLAIEALSAEAMSTSEIEGELLDRASIQSSLQRQLGLAADKKRTPPKEQGIAETMVDLYRSLSNPLSEEMLFRWHRKIMSGTPGITDIGAYRSGQEPMQVVSGPLHNLRVHFEAPPSSRVKPEMERFIAWFNRTAPGGDEPLPSITRAGTAHLYFESIHPFEDGNGRIGRAISEKALVQGLSEATLITLAPTILSRQMEYYAALEAAHSENEITEWLAWFGGVSLEAQRRTLALVDFVIQKARLIDHVRNRINERQAKALLRVLREWPQGFEGGLSAKNYVTITGASPATATRDLSDLVEKGAFTRTGELRHARYYSAVPTNKVPRITIAEDGAIVEE